MQLSDKTKIIALAHLKNGKRPKEVADLVEGLSYSQALTLKKELVEAEEQNTLLDLFSLDEATLETLLERTKEELTEESEGLIEGEVIQASVKELARGIGAAQAMEETFSRAASSLAKKIESQALLATSADSLLVLAEALAKLQTAFFAKGTNVQVNNFNGFESYLKD